MRAVVLLGAALVALAASATAAEKKVVCYFGSWAVYRPGKGKFDISYIDPSLCTHLIYTFVGLSGNKVRVLDAWQDLADNWGKNGFGRFNELKGPSTKTLIAIGGWNEGSAKYSKMASTAESRAEFTENVVEFVKKYNFDGFDLDWEYPVQRGGAPEDYVNYVELLKLMRKRFDEENLILSAAVAAAESSASKSFNIPEMSKYLHFINLMAYDLHGAWESNADINAPLHPSSKEVGKVRQLNVEASVVYWLSQGAPKEKLIVGVPAYGRAFTLVDPKNNAVGAPTKGPGKAGPYTREPGMIGYNEICEKVFDGSWATYYDEERQVPYAVQGDQWIGYDNVKSIRKKAEFIRDLDLGGAMVWSVETDDFRGVCGQKYPLLHTLNAVLRNGTPVDEESVSYEEAPEGLDYETKPQTSEESPKNPPAQVPTQSPLSPTPSGVCSRTGMVPHPNGCDYITCVSDGRGGFQEHEGQCPPGTCFDGDLGVCNWA